MSSNEGSIWGASINWDVQKMQNASQLFGYLAFSSGMNYMEGYNNPQVSKVSWDPKVRLDQAEIHSLNGFRTYDYIPISPESLAKNPGEVIPSLNAALVRGAGRADVLGGSRNIIDDMDEIAEDIININKKYDAGYEMNNTVKSVLNSASYWFFPLKF